MYCINCGKEIDDNSKYCNECGANQEENKTKKSQFIIIFIAIILVCIIPISMINRKKHNSNLENLDLKVVKSNFCKLEYGNNGICGILKNNSNTRYKYVSIKINLYDENNELIGSTLANKNNVEPQSLWNFQATISDPSIKTYKIGDITAY